MRRTSLFIILFGLVIIASVRFVAPAWIMNIRDAGFDLMVRTMPRATPQNSIFTLVAIDEAALDFQGQWPWPRHDMAKLADQTFAAGAAMIVFDINFAQSDRFNITDINRVLHQPIKPEQIIDTDKVLAEAISGRPVILASFRRNTLLGSAPHHALDEGLNKPAFQAGYFSLGEDVAYLAPNFEDFVDPIPKILGASQSVASVMVASDADGIIRHMPLVVSSGKREDIANELRFFLALEAVRVATGAAQYTITADPPGRALSELRGIRHIDLPDRSIPTTATGGLRLYESRKMGAKVISAKSVLQGTANNELEGKIAFIGLRTIGLGDRGTGPLGVLRRGIDFQVLTAEQILARQFLQTPRLSKFIEISAMTIITFMILGLLAWSRLSLTMRFVAASACALSPLFLSYAIFRGTLFTSVFADGTVIRYLFDGIFPSILGLTILLLGFGSEAIGAELQKRRLRQTFNRYLSPTVVSELMANDGGASLEPRDTEITVLFADIRGFTTMSEHLTAKQTVTLVNEFLAAMSGVVLDHNGTIDKFLGDGLMAFWNAPLQDPKHRGNAINAAKDLVLTIAKLNKDLAKHPNWKIILKNQPLRIGVGIHTGPASVGNFGSPQRVDYSCIGDTVNTAARIEGLCKEYNASVLVSDVTWVPKTADPVRVIEDAQIRGRVQSLKLYDLSPDENTPLNYGTSSTKGIIQ